MVEARARLQRIAHARHGDLRLTRGARIGVDIEHRDRELNVEGVARKFMSPREQAMLRRARRRSAQACAAALWTCKEAMSKATGDALSRAVPQARRHARARARLWPAARRPTKRNIGRLLAVTSPAAFLATVALWHEPPAGTYPSSCRETFKGVRP
jgi:hypothetical protein